MVDEHHYSTNSPTTTDTKSGGKWAAILKDGFVISPKLEDKFKQPRPVSKPLPDAEVSGLTTANLLKIENRNKRSMMGSSLMNVAIGDV